MSSPFMLSVITVVVLKCVSLFFVYTLALEVAAPAVEVATRVTEVARVRIRVEVIVRTTVEVDRGVEVGA